ncbi:MAG: Fe-S cluster assembly protein SufD [Deltaproteobacteria bacterium]|nr:Fe-S cluster assembly protein SufD [Deltaproteobacteria bacterium]
MLATDNKERYLAAFKQWPGQTAAPAWLRQLREAGIASFDALGFPTTRHEDWKYTNVDPIASQTFVRANGEATSLSGVEIVTRSMAEAQASRLVFVNGIFSPEFSQTSELPHGLTIKRLSEVIGQNEPTILSQLGRNTDAQRQAFVALNTAFFTDGAVISVEPGCRIEQPIYLVFVSTAKSTPVVSHPRALIMIGAGSEARIVESYVGLGSGNYFCNAVSELVGDADAVIEHYRIQQETDTGFHVGSLEANLARGCQLTAHAVSLSGALVRNHVHVVLNGEGAECVLNGLYLADGKQHIDNFTEIEHVEPRARSLELYKGILGGSAHGVFNGKIIVHKDAQKSDARQTNKNLLLSPDAVVNTKPQLEIYADDVKCSHGSTIGQLDGDALFYLRARGLGLDEAKSLLSFAFASDLVGRIKIPSLRKSLDEYLVGRFGRW